MRVLAAKMRWVLAAMLVVAAVAKTPKEHLHGTVATKTYLRSWAEDIMSLNAEAVPCATSFLQRGEDDDLDKKKASGSGSGSDEPETPGLPKLDPCGVPNKADLDKATDGPQPASINVTAADHKAAAYTGMAEPKDAATGGTGTTGGTGATGATGAGAAAVEHEEKIEAKKSAKSKIAAAKRALEKANEVEPPVVNKKFKEPGCEKIRKTAQGAYMIAPKADKSDWTTKELVKTICGAYTEIELGKDNQGNAEWKDECTTSVTFAAMARGWKNTDKRLTDSDEYKGCAPPREKELLECAIAFGIEQNNNFLGKNCRPDL